MTQRPEPYATYTSEGSDWCDYCEEGDQRDMPHQHEMFVSREGAAFYTADELARLFADETAALLAEWHAGEPVVGLYTVPEDLPDPDGWCEDSDDSQYLSDEINNAESALASSDFFVSWDDGFVIERVTESESVPDFEQDELDWIAAREFAEETRRQKSRGEMVAEFAAEERTLRLMTPKEER